MTALWVALETFVNESAGAFYEEGGVYDHDEPEREYTGRPLDPLERTVQCPRCGHPFAATEESTAEENRDLHFDGDKDCPSICRDLPARSKGLIRLIPHRQGEQD
jgi:hypothetical protein